MISLMYKHLDEIWVHRYHRVRLLIIQKLLILFINLSHLHVYCQLLIALVFGNFRKQKNPTPSLADNNGDNAAASRLTFIIAGSTQLSREHSPHFSFFHNHAIGNERSQLSSRIRISIAWLPSRANEPGSNWQFKARTLVWLKKMQQDSSKVCLAPAPHKHGYCHSREKLALDAIQSGVYFSLLFY